MVRDVTNLVHAQSQDALGHARQLQQVQSAQKGHQPQEGRQIAQDQGASGLSDAEIDELSGPEARALLKVSVEQLITATGSSL